MFDRLQRLLTHHINPAPTSEAEPAPSRLDSMRHAVSDIRAIGLLVFLGVVLLITWSGAKVIQTNYTLQKQISQLQQQNDVSQLSNNNLQLQNEYYNSNQYLELSARQNFGLGAAGETLLLVPNDVAIKHVTAAAAAKKDTPTAKQPAYQRNFQAWVNFFLDRPTSVPQP